MSNKITQQSKQIESECLCHLGDEKFHTSPTFCTKTKHNKSQCEIFSVLSQQLTHHITFIYICETEAKSGSYAEQWQAPAHAHQQ